MNDWDIFNGRKIVAVRPESKREYEGNWFVWTDQSKIKLEPYGACCSSSWFEDPKEAFEELVGSVVEYVEEIGEEEISTKEDNCKSLKQYFIKFKTNKGYVTLEMRNSSNGYYGGDVKITVIDDLEERQRLSIESWK